MTRSGQVRGHHKVYYVFGYHILVYMFYGKVYFLFYILFEGQHGNEVVAHEAHN